MADEQNERCAQPAGAFFLDQSSLKCKADCGFYGNPEWLGYCSLCFKELNRSRLQQQQQIEQQKRLLEQISFEYQQQQQQQRQPSPRQESVQSPQARRPSSSTGLDSHSPTISLSETPRTPQLEMKDPQPVWWQQPQQHVKQQIKNVSGDMALMDCMRLTNKFAKELLAAEKLGKKSINELSDMTHNFYQTMNERFETHIVYKGSTAEHLELLNDEMERVLNEHVYQAISTRIINEDEEHNIAVQKRIRSLNWITVEHLEINIDFQHPIVHDLLDKAICQMIEVNSHTSSIDKLKCIVDCSKTILELLQVSASSSRTGGPATPVSADQFLPVLVFVVIQANPPMLPADMRYLTRFSNPRRLMSGETGYYFTNLCCALEFIEKASGASLNISEEDFQKYVNGEAYPETKSQFSTYQCDGLRIMCSNEDAMRKLRDRNQNHRSKMQYLLEQIDVHLEMNRAKLKEMQIVAKDLRERIKPNLPKLYYNLMEQNREFAKKLLPSYLRDRSAIGGSPSRNIELSTEDPFMENSAKSKGGGSSNWNCINLPNISSLNIQSSSSSGEHSASYLIDTADASLSGATANDSKSSISPIEQLESSNFSLIELPEPLQPEQISVSHPTSSSPVKDKK